MKILGLELKKDHFLATFYMGVIFLLISLALTSLQIYLYPFDVFAGFIFQFALMFYLATRVFDFSIKDIGGLAIAYFIIFSIVELILVVYMFPEHLFAFQTHPAYFFNLVILGIISSKIWQTFLYTVGLGLILYFLREKKSPQPHRNKPK